jgi:hypothetical protein
MPFEEDCRDVSEAGALDGRGKGPSINLQMVRQLPTITILDTMTDRALFGRWFQGESWKAWKAFLAALFGLPFDDQDDAALFSKHTGRTVAPTAPAREAWVIVGRRGGKSRIAALVAVYLAAFRSYADVLAPGEVGTLAVIAADRRQARVVMRYIRAFLEVPMLRQLVTAETKESIELSNRVMLEVHTASFRAVRGYTLIGVIADEVAYWPVEENAADADREILVGLRPGMATIPGALLLAISSPYARIGELWRNYQEHYGKDDDPVLVFQSDTRTMNPAVDPQVIADAYAADDVAADAEYGANFRRDVETFISRETVEACVIPDRQELPPREHASCKAFTDPSGGSNDSFTLAIAHRDAKSGHAVLDAIRERRPPFSPDDVVKEFAALLVSYGITFVTGDRYAGEWPRERFRKHGIGYRCSEQPKSDIYRDVLPLLNAGTVELLDHPRLSAQLLGLERRTARSGKDSIDHAPRGHDDVANAAAGALLLVGNRKREGGTMTIRGW